MSIDQFQISPDSFFEGVRYHSARDVDVSKKGQILIDVEVDVADLNYYVELKELGAMPVLGMRSGPEKSFEPIDLQKAADAFGRGAELAANAGHSVVILSADNDGLLHWLLSPRHHADRPLSERLNVATSILKSVKAHIPTCGVALTVEELCPGGLDPTEGVAIAQAFEREGTAFLIASGGTIDFPALKLRRPTKIKSRDDAIFEDENEVWLASAAWLKNRVHVPVWAQGPMGNMERARAFAHECGINGIVQSSSLVDS